MEIYFNCFSKSSLETDVVDVVVDAMWNMRPQPTLPGVVTMWSGKPSFPLFSFNLDSCSLKNLQRACVQSKKN